MVKLPEIGLFRFTLPEPLQLWHWGYSFCEEDCVLEGVGFDGVLTGVLTAPLIALPLIRQVSNMVPPGPGLIPLLLVADFLT